MKSKDVGLIVRTISFQHFQAMWSWSTNVKDGQMDGQTDRQTDGRSKCSVTCEFAIKLLLFISTIAIYYYYSAQKSWYSFYHPTEGGRLSWPRHYRKGLAACARDCILQWLSRCTPLPTMWFEPGFSHTAAGCATTRPLWLHRQIGVNNLLKVAAR